MKITEIAAWWGAIVATVVFLWDIYKWRKSGVVLRVTASPNMQTFTGVFEEPKFVIVEVVNNGNKKTTLTHLVGVQYLSWTDRIRKKSKHTFFVPTPLFNAQLPYVLGVGERWMSGIEQTDELEKWSREGLLYIGVCDTSKTMSTIVRVKIPLEEKSEDAGNGKESKD